MEEENTPPTEPIVKPVEEDKPTNKIEEANSIVKEMKEQNDRFQDLVERREATQAEAIMSGKSEAGQVPVEPKEETPEEYADKVMRGEGNGSKTE